MKFSIIVVCLNAGNELRATLKSIITQSFTDFEVIVKDGGSTDGSLNTLPEDERIRIIREKDTGIYDAMNQAIEAAKGQYLFFLNCGDYLYDENVLQKISAQIDSEISKAETGVEKKRPIVIYGDILERISGSRVMSNPEIDEFACYRNVPCHQACFYDREMIRMHPFNTNYRVRADYEQFLWCFFIARAKMIYLNEVISSYMGGGYSESKENRKRSKMEHTEIVENYMPHLHVVRYRWRMILSLSPLRGFLARNPVTSGVYNKIKSSIYKKNN